MAEQEGAQIVDNTNRDLSSETTTTTTTTTAIDGECQLLPLLQGLLEAPDNEQTADSGTESGEDQRNGLIVEVQTALNKLSESLRDDQNDIQPERRQSLLQLVTKLQAGLSASVPLERRSSSTNPITTNRFNNRRRQRSNRHTVGVSSEELADARRLIEEIALHELTQPARTSLLQKQNSESSVMQNAKPLYRNALQNQKVPVRNAIAKPFSSSNSTVSGNSSSVQTPTEPCIDPIIFNEDTSKTQFPYRSISLEDQKLQRPSIDHSSDVNLKTIQQNALNESHSETEDDSTVKALPTDIKMQNNPLYYQKNAIEEDKLNRFNLKKLKMKRANTIDIPKPFKFFNDDDDDGDGDDSDCSLPEDDFNKRKRSNYLALRGPIRLNGGSNNNNGKTTVPVFEPKTDNDKKFLAFINKNSETNTAKTSLWSKPAQDGTVWKNKFGNIKTTFEQTAMPKLHQPQQQNSAKHFWKTTEMKSKWNPIPPQEQQRNIVTGSLKVKTFEPKPINQFSHAPQSAFKPIPKKVQAPPPPPPQPATASNIRKTVIKTPDKDLDSPLFLYSPKPINEPPTKQWIGKTTGESRVMNLVASKFANTPPVETPVVKPRKLSKETIGVYDNQTSKPAEKLTAPYLVKSLEDSNKNTVRKLSGQYDNYASFTTVKYSPNTNTHPTQYQQLPKQYPPAPNRQQPVQSQYQAPPRQQQILQNQHQLPKQHHPLPTQYQASTQHYQPQRQQQQQQYQQSPGYSAQHYNNLDQHQYTSSYQLQSKPNSQISNPTKQTKEPPIMQHKEVPPVRPPKLESQVSNESVHEYNAVSVKVMTGPVSQQAETVRQKSPMNRDGHDFAAAMNLRNSLQKLGNKTESKSVIKTNEPRRSPESFSVKLLNKNEPQQRKPTVSPHSFSYSSTDKKSDSESVITSKFQIPVINVAKTEPPTPPISIKMMNKADAWNQICLEQQQLPHKPSPRSSPNARTITKSKSSHSLSVPKQFEAGMSKDEMQLKRKTMEAFLSGGNKSPQPTTTSTETSKTTTTTDNKVVKRSINRLKTSEKSAMYRHTTIGLARSRTLPDFVSPQLLDETNVDQAFDELFNENS